MYRLNDKFGRFDQRLTKIKVQNISALNPNSFKQILFLCDFCYSVHDLLCYFFCLSLCRCL